MTDPRQSADILEMEALFGNIIERLLGDKGYRGYHAPPEPVVGHLKAEHRMGRNDLSIGKETPPTLSLTPSATTSAA